GSRRNHPRHQPVARGRIHRHVHPPATRQHTRRHHHPSRPRPPRRRRPRIRRPDHPRPRPPGQAGLLMSADLLLRWGALLLLSAQEISWAITERQAHRAKPKSVPKSFQTEVTRFVLGLFVLYMILQLIGKIHFAEFPPNIRLQATGLSLVFLSFC